MKKKALQKIFVSLIFPLVALPTFSLAQETSYAQHEQKLSDPKQNVEAGGGADGGGGNCVVCFNDSEIAKRVKNTHQVEYSDLEHITSIEILDLYEIQRWVEEHPGTHLERPQPNESVAHYIDRLDTRLGWMMPSIGQNNGKYHTLLSKRIRDHRKMVYHVTLPQEQFAEKDPNSEYVGLAESALDFSDDYGSTEELDENCALVTLLKHGVQVRYIPSGPGLDMGGGLMLPSPAVYLGEIIKFTIDARLFFHEKHSVISRIFSFLHEYFYIQTKAIGIDTPSIAENSLGARNILRLVTTYDPNRTASEFAEEYLSWGKPPGEERIARSYVRYLMEVELTLTLSSISGELWKQKAMPKLKKLFQEADALLEKLRVTNWKRPVKCIRPNSYPSSISPNEFLYWNECYNALSIIADNLWRKHDHFSYRGNINYWQREQARTLRQQMVETSRNTLSILLLELEGRYDTQLAPQLRARFTTIGLNRSQIHQLVQFGRSIIEPILAENHKMRVRHPKRDFLLEAPVFYYGEHSSIWHFQHHRLPKSLTFDFQELNFDLPAYYSGLEY